jgi:AcrR family transcriptional regulator
MRKDTEVHSGYYTEGPSVWQMDFTEAMTTAEELATAAASGGTTPPDRPGEQAWSVVAGGEPPAKMRADARRSRAKLLDAATIAFAENGADAPLDDIARRAGVGIGTLYRHFPTRLDLQAAVYRSQVQSVCATADELIATATPEQAFAGWVRALAGYLVTKRGLSSSLIAGLGKDSELMSSCWVAMGETAERLLTHAQRAGVLRSDIKPHDVLRLVHGIVVTTEQAPEDTDRLLSIMFDGLRPR